MSDGAPAESPEIPAISASGGAEATPAAPGAGQKKKVRSAWISFVSRILAQLIGAAATVILGIVALQRYQVVSPPKPAAEGPARTAVADVARSAGLPPKIAVLPFENYSGDAQYDHFANAMTETLVSTLAAVDTLRVISRTSSMHYKASGKALPEIGRELGADLIVEGSITKSGSRARVIAQLIDAQTDEHVWSRSYIREIGDALALQEEVTAAIVRDLKAVVAASQGRPGSAGRLLPGDQWQEPVPASRNVAPSTGMNSQR
jgi:TolB-like protein